MFAVLFSVGECQCAFEDVARKSNRTPRLAFDLRGGIGFGEQLELGLSFGLILSLGLGTGLRLGREAGAEQKSHHQGSKFFHHDMFNCLLIISLTHGHKDTNFIHSLHPPHF